MVSYHQMVDIVSIYHEYNLSLILYINLIKNEITTISIINGFSNEKCLKTFDF